MKYYAISLLLAFVIIAYATNFSSAEQIKPDNSIQLNKAETKVETESTSRNKRGLFYNTYSAPYAAYAYPYTDSYSYPYAYTAPYVYGSAYYPTYYSSYMLG